MSLKLKYVMFEGDWKTETPIIFPSYVQHSDVAASFSHWKVLSAGFVRINEDGRYECYGDSHSLKVAARDEDAAFINTAAGLNG